VIAIVGAGPFGLAAAAMAKRRGLAYRLFGRPMELWRQHMPNGMLLRSASGWHLDPHSEHTFEAFLAAQQPSVVHDGQPISLERFLDYSAWFIDRTGLDVDTRLVRALSQHDRGFELELEDGERVHAANVLCTPGVRYFLNTPKEYVDALPAHLWCHSTDVRDLTAFNGRRCLIIGGRQSAYELGTLLQRDAGADVTIVHRHPVPAFIESDWSWVADELRQAERTPGWFAALAVAEQEAIRKRFWSEGRLKLEPWLGERLTRSGLTVYANTAIERFDPHDGRVDVSLNNGQTVRAIDQVVLATGFVVNLRSIPYLTRELLDATRIAEGSPVLDSALQSVSVPGLYFAGLVAARDFGPYMGFLASCPFAARTIVNAIDDRRAWRAPL
jgi:thioredoxin reductase